MLVNVRLQHCLQLPSCARLGRAGRPSPHYPDFSPCAGYLAKLRQERLPVSWSVASLPATASPLPASADDIHRQYSAPPPPPVAPTPLLRPVRIPPPFSHLRPRQPS